MIACMGGKRVKMGSLTYNMMKSKIEHPLLFPQPNDVFIYLSM
jgi:hypothetical protein